MGWKKFQQEEQARFAVHINGNTINFKVKVLSC